LERGTDEEKRKLLKQNDATSKELLSAHEKNLACIATVTSVLLDLGFPHRLLCRTDMHRSDFLNQLVIAIGGDGTLLDCSHYCSDSPILGVNSDPESSIGALCAATATTFRDILKEIIAGQLLPKPLARLEVKLNGQTLIPLATNDLLFCHQNPASLSRFSIKLNQVTESHRSSGIWIATAAGSTGGIYSSGASYLNLNAPRAIFRMREPYWANVAQPKLLTGFIEQNDHLSITCDMTDGEIFIDGPHERRNVNFGDVVEISLANQPLWLFDGPRLIDNRKRIIERRESIRELIG
jgi:NAD+ kinase